jgi:hypothetical protein
MMATFGCGGCGMSLTTPTPEWVGCLVLSAGTICETAYHFLEDGFSYRSGREYIVITECAVIIN